MLGEVIVDGDGVAVLHCRDEKDQRLPGVELLERNCKLFVNVCGHAHVAAPGDWSDGKIPEEVSDKQ